MIITRYSMGRCATPLYREEPLKMRFFFCAKLRKTVQKFVSSAWEFEKILPCKLENDGLL